MPKRFTRDVPKAIISVNAAKRLKRELVRLRRQTHVLALFGCTIASLAVGCVVPSLSHADSRMSWSQAVLIDPTSTNPPQSALSGVSCPSSSLCVAVDRAGNVVSSNDPAGGASAWHVANVDPPSSVGCVVGGCHGLTGISCPSVSFCAAVDDQGNVLTSANPLAGPSSWRSADVDSKNAGCGYTGDCYGLTSISCPSASFCAAVDALGNVITSAKPAGGARAWHTANIDGSATFCTPGSGCGGLNDVSCASASLCIAADIQPTVLASSRPTGGRNAWKRIRLQAGGSSPLGPATVSCSSPLLCVAVAQGGDAYATTGPAGATRWPRTNIDGNGSERGLTDVACAPRTSLCIASDSGGNVVTSSSPLAGLAAWSITNIVQDSPSGLPCLVGGCKILLSCASGRFCLAVEGSEAVAGEGSAPPPPVSTSPPKVSGRPLVGRTLTEGRGRWMNQPTTFAYQWERCDRAGKRCKAIPGAEGSTYTVRSSDLQHAIRVQETALNGGGTGRTATSRPVQVKPARVTHTRAK